MNAVLDKEDNGEEIEREHNEWNKENGREL